MALLTDNSDTFFNPGEFAKNSVVCTVVQASCCFPCSLAQSAQKARMDSCFYKKWVMIAVAVLFGLLMFAGEVTFGVGEHEWIHSNRTDVNADHLRHSGDIIRSMGRMGLWLYFGTILYTIRVKINTDYGVVSDYTDCLCAFFCYHAIATEMNLMFKGYIYGGCCGDADSQREIQQLTPTAKSPSEVSMN